MAGKAGAIRAGRAYVELYADNTPLVRGLKMAERQMRAFGGKLKALGSQMTMAGILGTAPAAVSMKWFMEFDDAMRAVKASTGATGQEFEALTAKARELGRSTSYTSAEVAKAMLELGRAGFDSAGIDASIAGMLDLARATGTELPLATEIAAATLQGFGLEASEMARVADVLVATANGSAVSLEDLGESMKYVAPIASEAGMSLEDTAKSLGTLANMGIKGSMAGTSLRQILLRLANSKVQAKMHAIGVEALTASGDLRKMGDIMIDLGVAMAGMPNAERLSLMRDLFDQRAVTGAVKLSSVQFERLNTLIDTAFGLARRQAAEMDAGFGGAWREMTGAIEDVALAVGNALEPTLISLAQYLRDCANAISAFIAENQGLVLAFTAVSAGLVILGPIVTGLGMAMTGAAAGVGALATAVGLVVTPLGLLAAGVAAVLAIEGTATDALKTHFQTLGSTVTEVMGAMNDAVASGDLKLAMQAMVAGIRLELLRLQDMWWSFWEGLPGMGYVMEVDEKAFIKRINDIAKAENALTQIGQQAAQQAKRHAEAKRQAETDRLLAEDFSATYASELGGAAAPSPTAAAPSATAAGPLPGWLTSTAAKIAGLDPAKILQGVGQFIGDASQAVPEFVANTAMNLTDDIAPEAGFVSQIQRSARGTFSSLAAGRMGAVGSATNRTERQLAKLVQKQDHANKRLDQFVDLASKAKLVFTGALPG